MSSSSTLARSRENLARRLRLLGADARGDFADWHRLTRAADALRPTVFDELERHAGALRMAFDIESALQDIDTVELLDDLVRPFVRARVPLRPRAEATAWVHASLSALLERFDATETIHALYDCDGHHTTDEANPPEVVARIALAAGWLAWSDLLVDPVAARTHRRTLARALDIVDARLRDTSADHETLDVAWAALTMERRLARHAPAAVAAAS